uniref:Uncharacterized protein n=1 Tax=Avena sativa TaxID=4498 RepID=A0ACD5TIG6_AVESA
MVMKRASIEPNFHDLYLKFFDKVNSKLLNKEMVKATYENCKALLQSDLIKSSSEERSLLKNLGSWLGKLTIGRNQTLRAKEIDPKILIVEAYERGLMIAVVPFTSKILEPCHSSIAYRPPNPWTMGILSLLTEIYNLPNLKMNLKFDIEVLFKNLSVDMKDVKPSSFLKDRIRQIEGNPDFSNKDVSASQMPVVAEVSSGMMPAKNLVEVPPELTSTSRATSLPNMLNQYAPPLRLPPNSMVEDDKVALIMPDQVSPSQTPSPSPALFTLSQLIAAIPRADIYFRINEKLSSLGSLQYSKIMDVALDKAIKEIIGPVIQRSVTIATRTTKELTIKDLAMESDDSAVSRAAHLMVGTLAGSLAHVTSKEPLRVALSSHLRSLIQNLNNNNESTEQIVHILINDNLDLGCALIETVATRKAVEMIDGEIKQPFSQLRRQKELLGSGYYDAFPYTQGLARVPDALRPKPAGLLGATQQRVYEDFITVWHSQSSQNAGATTSATTVAVAQGNSSVPRLYSPNLVQPADLVPEEPDHGTTQLLSVSAQIGTSDTFQVAGTTSITSLFPSMSSNDVPVGEPTVVTEDLGSTIPLSPTSAVDRMESVFAEPLNTEDALDRYQQVAHKIEAMIANDGKDADIQCVIAEVPDILHRCVSRDEAALAIAQKVFRNLYENASKGTSVTWILATLVAICDVCKLVVKEITSWELAVAHTVVSEQVTAPGGIPQQPAQQLQISYFSVDSYSKLVTFVVKYCVDLAPNKGSLLSKILFVTARTIQKDAEEKKVSFNPRPYFRLFINLLSELSTADLHDAATFQVLTAFANAFHVLQPLRVPAWSFAWLELVSHRSFMPKLLLCNSQKGWPLFQRLLVDLFKFMEPYLRNAEMGQPIHLLYKGTLRVLLVLLHDFPEFLCDYHLSFCDVIPPSCIQMRNVILSAFPRNMRLPDPSTPNLKIDLLPEISKAPRIMSDVESALKAKQMKTQVDEYLKRPEGSSFLTDLKQRLLLPPNEANVAGTRYNVPLINSLVVYVGIQAVHQLQHNKANASAQQINQSSQVENFQIETATEVYRSLIVNMDTEGRYLVLNAIANQLRYPNNHTHYFSFIILYLFAEAAQDIVQEQITRVLLERLIVNRPHPWGLLITFVELIKNPRYSFWARPFTHCAPEIERLFQSVARSCGGKAVDEGVVLADGSH